MKGKIYLRVAEGNKLGTFRAAASQRPSHAPLYDTRNNPLPTAAFALELDIPRVVFERAAKVIAEIKIPEEQAEIAAEVVEVN